MPTLSTTPAQDGYTMPGEFEPHTGTWMLWPQRFDTYRMGAVYAQRTWVTVAETIARFEPLTIGVNHDQYRRARKMLPPTVRVLEISSNDAWTRDSGPTFLTNRQGGIRGVHWQFNAWGGFNGGAYFPWDEDLLVAEKILTLAGADRYCAPFILEGGSIHSDGQGTILTTEECLLNPNRNPHLAKEQIEAYLKSYLGAQTVIWLPRGVAFDETSGHVDNFACFARPAEVILAWSDDPNNPNYERVREGLAVLENSRDAQGRPFTVHKLQLPPQLHRTKEEALEIDENEFARDRLADLPLAGSYVNFYLVNGGVILPVFGEATDANAIAVLQGIFPDRQVVAVPGREILLGGGNVHCITQQQPA
ncbi:MAG TPA: agmatine deiminase [Anaerolineales bacterium]|nr:agmatine deiminase [Anaerolineales bacterium]